MRRVFDEQEAGEVDRGSETEFTLGSKGLLIVLAGLLAVCGLCFGLGYAVGHRGPGGAGAGSPQAAATATSDTPLIASASKQKPSAAPPPAAAPASAENVSGDIGAANDPDADVVGGSSAGQPSPDKSAAQQAPSGAAGLQSAVKPALPAQPVLPTPTAVPGSNSSAASAGTQQAVMVQIAAVSHAEDADVLVNALRRRGYAVSAHRDLSDSLIHVRVGPFFNRNDANAMRLKLLNDGYNAVIEP